MIGHSPQWLRCKCIAAIFIIAYPEGPCEHSDILRYQNNTERVEFMTYTEIRIPLATYGHLSVHAPIIENRVRVSIGGKIIPKPSAPTTSGVRNAESSVRVILYTNGACSGNPGIGGWGAILYFEDGSHLELSGSEEQTTSNRMELQAVIQGLHILMVPHEVHIYTDSQYVVKTMAKEWERQKNQELWEELDNLSAFHDLHFHWVRGHGDIPFNERCDAMSKAEIAKRICHKTGADTETAPAG